MKKTKPPLEGIFKVPVWAVVGMIFVWLCLVVALIYFGITTGYAEVTVGSGKDYESFTQACWESGDNIVVYPGTYDIKAEYEELFGEKVPSEFRWGIFLHDRTVNFLPGSKLTCVWYRDDIFSPIYSGGNLILYGMDLYAEGMMYAVHDDLWHFEEPYTNIYKYCRIIGRKLKNANCIGGGVARNARIIIDNCYFDNGVDESVTVRYHNVDLAEASGCIWISDSYFNGYLGMCFYGATSHLDVFVNGCKAKAVRTQKETPDSWIQNIALYKWNNEEEE